MSDMEQYEAAAKAAGYELAFAEGRDPVYPVIRAGDKWVPWRPKDDDGDAFRLAVALNLVLDIPSIAQLDLANNPTISGIPQDKMNATRRAIFRAAYEVGASMP